MASRKKSDKKKWLCIIAAVVIVLGAIGGVWFWQKNKDLGFDDTGNKTNTDSSSTQYSNNRYHYSLTFPKTWFLDTVGDSEEQALGIILVSDKQDLKSGDGGPPLGAKIEIFIHDLVEFAQNDSEFPQIQTIEDWIAWQQTYWQSFDTESKGTPVEEKSTVSDLPAITSTFANPLYPEMAKSIEVQLLDSSKQHVFVIQYIAQEPAFSNNSDVFNQVVQSFHFTQ